MGTRFVVIYYGPCVSHDNFSYKPQKLAGLRDRLRTLSFRVNLVPVKSENHCLVTVGGYEVFRCNIKHLMFNTPHIHDPVCQRAVAAVVDGSKRLIRGRIYIWLYNLLNDNIFIRGQFEAKAHFCTKQLKESPKLLPRVEECIKCCGIVTKEK